MTALIKYKFVWSKFATVYLFNLLKSYLMYSTYYHAVGCSSIIKSQWIQCTTRWRFKIYIFKSYFQIFSFPLQFITEWNQIMIVSVSSYPAHFNQRKSLIKRLEVGWRLKYKFPKLLFLFCYLLIVPMFLWASITKVVNV